MGLSMFTGNDGQQHFEVRFFRAMIQQAISHVTNRNSGEALLGVKSDLRSLILTA